MTTKKTARPPLQDECKAAVVLLRALGALGNTGFSPMTLASVLLRYRDLRVYAYGDTLYAHLMKAATLKGLRARGGSPSEVLERFLHQSTYQSFGQNEAREYEYLEDRALAYQRRTGKIFNYDPSQSARENMRRLREDDLAALRSS
jgi:hypothetical protein